MHFVEINLVRMMYMKNDIEKKKTCFIITPIGDEKSDTFRRAKGVIESVIKPVLQKYGFEDIKPSYEINLSGMISTQIINRIIDDDLVIANLTDNNPNVMYELCLRHVVAKPIIHICENGTNLPFDIKDNRTVFYENDMLGVEELKEKMMGFLDEISYDNESMDNPIYVAYRHGKLLKETQGTEENGILKLLLDISGQVEELKAISYESKKQEYSIVKKREYTVGEFMRDIRSVEKKGIEDAREINHNVKVYELSKLLNLPSKTIITIANSLGISVVSYTSNLKCDEKNKILDYIMSET